MTVRAVPEPVRTTTGRGAAGSSRIRRSRAAPRCLLDSFPEPSNSTSHRGGSAVSPDLGCFSAGQHDASGKPSGRRSFGDYLYGPLPEPRNRCFAHGVLDRTPHPAGRSDDGIGYGSSLYFFPIPASSRSDGYYRRRQRHRADSGWIPARSHASALRLA